jgi:cellulose biosynthesis protein BcsQ
VPIVPTPLSVRTLDQLAAFVDDVTEHTPRLLPFLSMVDSRKKLHRDLSATLPARRPELLKTAIPSSAEIERMSVRREPVGSFAPRSTVAAAFADLWREIDDRLR